MRSQASRHKSPAQPDDTAQLAHGFVQGFLFDACGAQLLCSASVVDLMQSAPKGRADKEVTMTKNGSSALQGNAYCSFSTRKRSGDWVSTPVWFAPDGDSVYLFSAGNAGKVKRLRNFPDARVAPCTVTGTVTGAWIEAEACLLTTPADEKTALDALRRKYGLQMLAADFFSKLTGKMQRRAYIRVNFPAT